MDRSRSEEVLAMTDATELRASITAMDDVDLATLVRVASHALSDIEVTEMLADEIGVPVDQLRLWFDTKLSPVEDPNRGPWHLAEAATEKYDINQ